MATAGPAGPQRAWREVELVALTLLVLCVYFSRLTDLTIRGEESRWARVAQEMLETGDWIVPRQQGQPFLDRPPLNSWAMIVASQFTGQLDLLAIRLPAALATLLTTLVIYLYGRNFLSRAGALAAAAAYATMGQVLQLGRLAESDALLTLCLSGALFSWHYGYARRRDPRAAWLAGYALAALAALAKGPQGPVYFVAITTVFLGLGRDWRFLFSRWHLAGVALFVAIIGSWQVPFMLSIGPALSLQAWTEGGHVASRLQWNNLPSALTHWVAFPFEVFACMLPWSLLLPPVATRWFRGSLDEARPWIAFLVTAFVAALPTCWLPVDSRPRYLMSLFPCVALVIGLVVQRSFEARQTGWSRRSWDQFLVAGLGLVLAAPVILAAWRVLQGWVLPDVGLSASGAFLTIYAVAAVGLSALGFWSRGLRDERRAQVGVMVLAGFMGLTSTALVVNVQIHASNDPSTAIAEVRQQIPPGEQLVSYGQVHHLFAYYYEQPIGYEPLENDRAPVDSTARYFCFSEDPGFTKPTIPFAWQRVAEISCERARRDKPLAKVVIGIRSSSDVARARAIPRSPGHVSPASFVESADTRSEPSGVSPPADAKRLPATR